MRVLAAVLLVSATFQIASAYSCTWRGVECIDYEILSNEAEYEERQYPETMWISVTTQATSLYDAKRRSFRKLIYYIQAFNDQNVTVDLTTPHRTRVSRVMSSRSLSNYTMAFPLPNNLYGNPPRALDKEVFIQIEPPRKYIVKVFGGTPTEQDWLRQAEGFIQKMRKDSRVLTDHYYVARYDLVFWVLERRNEIWLVKK
ncbi:heme-binding protein 2-like [Ixodes scapularis]|uniref:heme-binding protein 2-like n=1 Tax=Ixodes scapularis TaxID=6945 RepID=UPI001C3863F3|nr:heme-binding protein 2-like [Ixodes scapularis]